MNKTVKAGLLSALLFSGAAHWWLHKYAITH